MIIVYAITPTIMMMAVLIAIKLQKVGIIYTTMVVTFSFILHNER